MSTQQDIYAAGSENRPPMLNKDKYVPWSSRIIRYARSRPNDKMIVDSIENGPYELTENDPKRMDADDQAMQTILLGLPKDVYAAVDSCETAKEIWEDVRQMMKGLRVLELGIKPSATTEEDWVIFLGIALPDQEQGMLLIFRLRCSLLKRKKQGFNFKQKNLTSWLLQ
nr:hypothetical protein [Tanacetum cinerariifolium]